MRLFDTHCHFETQDAAEIAAILVRAKAAGVERLVAVGGSDALNAAALAAQRLAVAGERDARPYPAVGSRVPRDRPYPDVLVALGYDREQVNLESSIRDNPCNPWLNRTPVAIGEIGLDYHYSPETRAAQMKLFAAQLEEARKRDLPVVIHTREAADDTIGLLKDIPSRGVIHCFTGDPREARAYLDLGFFVSISGIVTFKAAENVRETARYIPDDRIVIETDSPFLAPVPMRGKPNEPSFLRHTCEFLAKLRGLSPIAFAEQTFANAERLFASLLLLFALVGCVTQPPQHVVEEKKPLPPWKVMSVVEHARPAKPEGLSGVTRVEGDGYLSVEDRGGRLWTLNVTRDAAGGVTGCKVPSHVVLEGVVDGEGCAWDPLRKTIWVSDEVGPHVSEHDAATGKRLGELALTDDFKKIRNNLGPEGLTISPDGLTLWTCPEEATLDDGATASPTNGTLVHLHRYVRKAGTDPWRAAESIPYRTDPMGGHPYKNVRSSGVAGLCALADGTLLVLERELSVKDKIIPLPSFRLRLYEVRPGMAKRLVLTRDTGIANYEGVCRVKESPDGKVELLLVSDGEGLAAKTLMSILLAR